MQTFRNGHGGIAEFLGMKVLTTLTIGHQEVAE